MGDGARGVSTDVVHAVDNLASALQGSEPLTFVLGAGTSLSSGAPSTDAVAARFRQSHSRFGAEVRGDLHQAAPADKRASLEPLFEAVVPYIGYRLLAALGRSRRILVLNLNWDDALARACELLGVPCVSYDAVDRSKWALRDDLPAGRGLVVIHLHGELAGNPRFGLNETATSDARLHEHVAQLHDSARRVYVGASLHEDHDVVELLRALDDGASGATWAFFKGPRVADVSETARLADRLGARTPMFCQDPSVDFDTIMMLLTDGLDHSWADLQKEKAAKAPLPAIAGLVLPKPGLLRPLLDASFVALVGDANLGKTTVAHVLAWVHKATRAAGSIRSFQGAEQAMSVLSTSGATHSSDVLILDDALGLKHGEISIQPLAEAIYHWTDSSEKPSVILTSRVSAWNQIARSDLVAGVAASPAGSAAWYEIDEIRRYAGSLSDRADELQARVRPEDLDTPGRVLDCARGLAVTPSIDGPARNESGVAQRLDCLETDPALAKLAAVTRLASVCGGEPIEAEVLENVAGGIDSTRLRQNIVYSYEWEGGRYLRLDHVLAEEATDRWMQGNNQAVRDLIEDAAAPPELALALDGWETRSAVRSENWDAIAHEPTAIAEHAALLLEAAPSGHTLELISEAAFDPWSLADFAYALVDRWSSLPSPARTAALSRTLDDRDNCGTYAVLEACLYRQRSVDPEIVHRVQASLWDLINESAAWEIALAIDGYAWRGPAGGDSPNRWVVRAMDGVPALDAVLPVMGTYHPEGLNALGLESRHLKVMTSSASTDPDITVRLVRWHFVHQARARAQLGRQHWVDKDYLCRTLHPAIASSGSSVDKSSHAWLMQVLQSQGHPGWAFHVGAFLMGALGRNLGSWGLGLMRESISACEVGDLGLATAAVTYDSTAMLHRELRGFYEDESARNALLDVLASGVEIDGTTVARPHFNFSRPADDIVDRLGLQFPRLGSVRPSLKPIELSLQVRVSLEPSIASGLVTPRAARRLVEVTRAGDLRPLDEAVAAFEGTPRFDELCRRAATSLMVTDR